MKKTLLSFFALSVMFASCKKDDDKGSGGGGSASETTLSAKKWKLAAYTYNLEGLGEIDGFAMYTACQKDNTMRFKSDKGLEVDEGATKCNPSAPQTTVGGRWELRSGDKELRITGFEAVYGVSELNMTIVSLDSSTLKVEYITTINGPTVVNKATYVSVD